MSSSMARSRANIDHAELALIGGLQHQIANLVGLLAIVGQGAEDVSPEIIPLFFSPGVIALKAGDAIGEPVAEQLPVGAVLGVEVGWAHGLLGRRGRWPTHQATGRSS